MFWGKKQWRNTHKFCAYVRTYVRLQCHKYAVPSPVKGKKPWIFLVQNCEKLLSHTRTHILIRGVKGAVLGTKQHRVELYTLTRSQRYRLYCALLESSSILMSTSPQGIKRSTGVAANHSAVYAAAVVVVYALFVLCREATQTRKRWCSWTANTHTLMLLLLIVVVPLTESASLRLLCYAYVSMAQRRVYHKHNTPWTRVKTNTTALLASCNPPH